MTLKELYTLGIVQGYTCTHKIGATIFEHIAISKQSEFYNELKLVISNKTAQDDEKVYKTFIENTNLIKARLKILDITMPTFNKVDNGKS